MGGAVERGGGRVGNEYGWISCARHLVSDTRRKDLSAHSLHGVYHYGKSWKWKYLIETRPEMFILEMPNPFAGVSISICTSICISICTSI